MQAWDQEFKKLLNQLNITIEGIIDHYQGLNLPEGVSKEDEKKLKKKIKKSAISLDDAPESAVEKTKKFLQDVYKNYEATAKQAGKYSTMKTVINSSKAERDSSVNQVKMTEALQKQFRTRYEDTLKKAQEVEKQEQNKRKALIEELQQRIKAVQDEYEVSGKDKIEKYRQNQTLKHELSKIEPQAATTESLMDAQLKKKEIQIQIQMTTLKQKIQMMSNFKKMGEQTKQKLEQAQITNKKIQQRLSILEAKQNQNKIVVTRAHLILEQYKKAISRINQLLAKHQKQAVKAQQNLIKKKQSAKDLEKGLANLDAECQTQKNQIQILLKMQQNLKRELAQ